ncbi:MAG: PDZ domain-containing protein, partial [Chloroflexota bacterium]|nr:PDZ domain-containing protein [Chloroflexota bacterium]
GFPFNPRMMPNQPAPGFQPRGVPPTQNVVNGARVVQLDDNSPASKAGLQVGDVITAVGGVKIDASHSLGDLVQAKKPGDTIDLAVTRGTQNLTITVTLGASPQNSSTAYLGIRYAPVTPDGSRSRFPTG